MYLPKHQYTTKSLDELDGIESLIDKTGNFVNIIGKNLIITSFGEIFERSSVNIEKGDFSKAKQLYPFKSTEQIESSNDTGFEIDSSNFVIPSSLSSIKSSKIPPTSQEIQAGIMRRCFYINTSTGISKEVKLKNENTFTETLKRYEKVECIDWEIKGPIKDQTINGYFLEGIETKNQKKIDQLRNVIPGIDNLILSNLEYVEDTQIPTGQQIITDKKGLVVPSPSK